jgi:hypothetical protein
MTLKTKPYQTRIFSWDHQRGMPAQCLVRLYVLPSELIFITSELQQNRHIDDTGCGKVNGLGSDFVNLANLIWKYYFTYPQVTCFWEKWESNDSQPLKVTWLQHHGLFSDWDVDEEESFTQVILMFERGIDFFNSGKNQRYPDEKTFTTEQVKNLCDNLYMEDIEIILKREEQKESTSKSKSSVKAYFQKAYAQIASFDREESNYFSKIIKMFTPDTNNFLNRKNVTNDKSIK